MDPRQQTRTMQEACRSAGRPARAALILSVLMTLASLQPLQAGSVWQFAAKALAKATLSEAKADCWLELAKTQGLSRDELQAAKTELKAALKEDCALAREQLEARLGLAEELGEDAFPEADSDPTHFVSAIDNPLMPLTPGTTRIYEGDTEDGFEHIEVTVTDDTVEVLGVTCTVVRDTVKLDGEVIEDTFDWFAQDVDGNVWYFGELSMEFDEEGDLISLEGSWKAGRDGAVPGIVMLAAPTPGDVYRQEFLLGEAEDYARVEALGESVTVAAGTYPDCVRTFESTPIEPDVEESKYYAPGVGLVLEINTDTGERIELVGIITP